MATSLGEALPGSTGARRPASATARVCCPESSPLSSDRERFWNVPNTITVVRLAVLPVLVASSRDANLAQASTDGQRKIRVVGPEYYYAE